MPNRDPGSQQKKPEGPPPTIRNPWFWWLVFAALLAWNVMAWWPHEQPSSVSIPYSTFVSQVRGHNVSAVHIVGADISGEFVKPVQWPQPTPETASAKKTPPQAQPEKKSPSTGQQAKEQQPTGEAAKPKDYAKFHTVFPTEIGDNTLMPLLEANHVEVKVSSKSEPWLFDLLVNWVPMLLLIGFFWWMATSAARGQAGMFGRLSSSKARRYTKERSKVTFNDVAGVDEAKAELQEEVDFLRNPRKYHEVGARIPRGVLLVGPPGTGKTLLARAVAGEADVPFFSLNASEFVEMFVGVGASRVRDLFRQAKEAAPAIVFIDELDAVGRRRGAGIGTVNDEREQTLNQMLGELDGFDERHEIIVLAATNRPDVLDPALLRPGRFDRQVVVGLPDRQGREAILRIHTRKLRLTDVDLSNLARRTIGLSGADLANLCNEAALAAARHNRNAVTMQDFDEAQDKIRLGAARAHLSDPAERRVVAYHESGHALVAWLTPGTDPVYKVTIVPHGLALGLTEQLPGEERHNLSRSYLKARLAVMLGGHTAEELVFGEVTTGAENDLVEATRLARRMVTRWGMGKLGFMALDTDEQQPFLGYKMSQGHDYSEATAALVDREMQRLLEEAHDEVKRLLENARPQLDLLVHALLEEETLGLEELNRILGPRASTDQHGITTPSSTNNGG